MSKKPEMMAQCRLRCGNKVDTTWIDARGARVGTTLSLKDRDGLWEVVEVGAHMPAAEVLARSRDHAHQREASDV